MSIGSFCIVKNEAEWIAPHLLRILPWIDEVVLYDGNSTDGTLEIIKAIQKGPNGHKIKLFEDQDPKDLKDDYVRIFNNCLHSLSTDLAIFLHPDQYLVNPELLTQVGRSKAIALSCQMQNFAGEPDGQLFEIAGRQSIWKNIYRLRNPDLGAHYHGWYGAWNEDVYFSEITGNEYMLYNNISDYPYEVVASGLEILHFSDVRPYSRRLGRMKTCMEHQGWGKKLNPEEFTRRLLNHPRVTLKSGHDAAGNYYQFTPARYPLDFIHERAMYSHLVKPIKEAIPA